MSGSNQLAPIKASYKKDKIKENKNENNIKKDEGDGKRAKKNLNNQITKLQKKENKKK